MKRIVCIAVTVFVMVSTCLGISSAVSYTDLQPTQVLSSDTGFYVNSNRLLMIICNLEPTVMAFRLE